jgi:hypothetical protein
MPVKKGVTVYPSEVVSSYLETLPSGQRSRWINEQLEKSVGNFRKGVDLAELEKKVEKAEDAWLAIENYQVLFGDVGK